MSQHQLEIRRRLSLKGYLKELSFFAGRLVDENELTPLQFIEEFREKIKDISKAPPLKFALTFQALQLPEFASFIKQLHGLNAAPVYLWTSQSKDCGLFKLEDVSKVNFNFPFEANSEGILTIVTADGKDRMLLDFSEEKKDTNQRRLNFKARIGLKRQCRFPSNFRNEC